MLLASAALLAASAALAQEPARPWYLTLYLQQSWPKQTNTNAQIQQINAAFGTHFDDWSDVANLSLGMQLFKRVAPHWKLGLQLDYSEGALTGSATVPTEAGPARLAFEQRYSVYSDLYVVAHYLPWPEARPLIPFVYAGAGVAYEKDKTTLDLGNDAFHQGLLVKNDGWFPSCSLGLGADIPLGSGDAWYVEVGAAYVWARLKHTVAASGELAPAPTVTADTDSTGPNVWLGVGTRF
ncbi:MAG TPA: outer membrane beta-barrel protein [Thermoanaerobaculaceae bacterium]|nr:outer membrane beta-barrel protein [Thermoanaerobaculaceae bacterium]